MFDYLTNVLYTCDERASNGSIFSKWFERRCGLMWRTDTKQKKSYPNRDSNWWSAKYQSAALPLEPAWSHIYIQYNTIQYKYIYISTQQSTLNLESNGPGCLPLHITSFPDTTPGPHTHKDSRYNQYHTPEIQVTWSTFSNVSPPLKLRPVGY